MSLPIRMSIAARRDRARLAVFLVETNPAAALRAVDTIVTGITALGDYPLRGQACADGLRELMIPFGQSGYVAVIGSRGTGSSSPASSYARGSRLGVRVVKTPTPGP